MPGKFLNLGDSKTLVDFQKIVTDHLTISNGGTALHDDFLVDQFLDNPV